MSHETDTARRYRLRATQLRAIGNANHDHETARTVERLAEEYELMAKVFDDMHRTGLTALRARKSN
jgi:hypothetical protein